MKEETFSDVNQEEALKKLTEKRDEILNDFAKAYLAETKVLPSEVELVTEQKQEGTTIETVFYFRKKIIDNNTTN